MPELNEQMYCSQQIIIPPKYPYILKKYAKAAIKTQPLDLLRWSFLYFKSMEEGRCPPVKERLEFPPLDHDSGLTVGILKILANQLPDVDGYVKINIIKKNWAELSLCPVILQKMLVLAGAVQELAMPKLAFLAVATGFLTLSLTHTMILIFDVLSKEEEQPSLQLEDVLFIYNFLANIDASETKHYSSGLPMPQEKEFNGIEQTVKMLKRQSVTTEDDFWHDTNSLYKVSLIDDIVSTSNRLSVRLNQPIIGFLERAPSVERASKIERANFYNENKGLMDLYGDYRLDEASEDEDEQGTDKPDKDKQDKDDVIFVTIRVFDENDKEIPYQLYGELSVKDECMEEMMQEPEDMEELEEQEKVSEGNRVAEYIATINQERQERVQDMINTFDELEQIVDRFNTANYDLGVVAGRQLSSTSGEFIAQYVKDDIMGNVNAQIDILPDPNLKKKKAKPEEVEMVNEIVITVVDQIVEVVVSDEEASEEEIESIPDVLVIDPVPGISSIVHVHLQEAFVQKMTEAAIRQNNQILPRNIRCLALPIENDETQDSGNTKK